MRVSVVQFRTKLGDISYNIEHTAEMVRSCIADGASICLFPELSITGYWLKDLTFEVAFKRNDERLKPLLSLSKDIDIIVGLVEEDDNHIFYNSAFLLRNGTVNYVHRKVYLPTYGMFDEGRFVGKGNKVDTFQTNDGKASVLICEDLWHPSNLYLSFIQGVKLIFAQSASPGRGYKDKGMFGNAEVWKNMGEFYSRMMGSYVFYANRVGVEDGFVFSGSSFIYGPYGNLIKQGSSFNEDILTVDVSKSAIRSARINLPLLRDERPDTVERNIRRILSEKYD